MQCVISHIQNMNVEVKEKRVFYLKTRWEFFFARAKDNNENTYKSKHILTMHENWNTFDTNTPHYDLIYPVLV